MNQKKVKCGLVLGLANQESIAYACARKLADNGAELIGTYGHPKAAIQVEALTQECQNLELMFCDVRDQTSLDQLFERAKARWGRLDFLVHSIAFAQRADLHGRVVDSSTEGFLEAMDISCHSFARLARRCEPLMTEGGSLVTMSYLGAQRVVEGYGLMGPVKAALESLTRSLAAELGGAGIRVNAISAGPIHTRAASSIAGFDELARKAQYKAPLKRLTTQDEVAALCNFLISDDSSGITGGTHFVDAGVNIID